MSFDVNMAELTVSLVFLLGLHSLNFKSQEIAGSCIYLNTVLLTIEGIHQGGALKAETSKSTR